MTGWEWIVDDLGTELYQEDWGGGMGRVPVLHPGSSCGRKGGGV